MSDRQVRVVISAVDKGAGGKLTEVGDKGAKAGHRIADGFSKVGQLIGGEVGNAIQEASDKLEHFGKGNRMVAVGAAAAGLGGILSVMGSKEQAASQQLDLAITNSGHSVDEYGKRIEDTVGRMEHFGHSAVETKTSLMTLTNATHDPAKALNLMGEAADLAASKHISLETAATQLARVIGGHGAKTLASYNLAVVKNADGTTNWTATNEKLAAVLKGQASAASDTFSGRLKALRTEVEDNVATFGQKYGPAILIAGTATSTLGPLLSKAGSAMRSFATTSVSAGTAVTTAQAEVAAAEAAAADAAGLSATEQAAAQDRVVAAHAAAATAVAESDAGIIAADEEAGAAGSLALGPIGIAAAAVVGGLALATHGFGLFGGAAKKQIKPTDDFTNAILNDSDALGANTRKLVENTLEKSGGYDAALKLGIGQKTLTDAMMGNAAALQVVRTRQGQATAAGLAAMMAHKSLTKAQKDEIDANAKLNGITGTVTKTLEVNKHAADNLAAANGKVAKSHQAAGSSAQADRQAMIGAHDAADGLRGGLGSLGRALDIINRKHAHPSVSLFGGGSALTTVNNLTYALDHINGQQYIAHVTVTQSGGTVSGSGVKFNAGGTDYFSGGLTHIAEREPEAVYLPRGSKIKPLSGMRASGTGGGTNITVYVTVPVGGSAHDTGRAIAGALEQYAGAGGKIRIKAAVN